MEVIAQATKTMDILKKSYPDDGHATTHLKWARDAISERRMPASTSKEEKNRLVQTPSLDESERQFFGARSGPSTV
ncbi:hypothetical protein BDM02DRAFT_3116648 [Thelephora ganbajun]|uniref:Uncharacterized protein n=1 Tax=Thelephora ganbajun TaxID=370292 RepID=A0ACB6ZEB7_THEGA|nr:hypothetical protein BDM02DRAFT_3116648 [Thelephora ganbajun]